MINGRFRVTPSGCHVWTGSTSGSGYGKFKHNGKQVLAHRMAWVEAFGPIPPGLMVCHRCDNPPCVNPTHLFLGTAKDNVRDCIAKGRWSPRRRRGVKLTAASALAILVDPRPAAIVAAEYSVTTVTIRKIRRREIWRDIEATTE